MSRVRSGAGPAAGSAWPSSGERSARWCRRVRGGLRTRLVDQVLCRFLRQCAEVGHEGEEVVGAGGQPQGDGEDRQAECLVAPAGRHVDLPRRGQVDHGHDPQSIRQHHPGDGGGEQAEAAANDRRQ